MTNKEIKTPLYATEVARGLALSKPVIAIAILQGLRLILEAVRAFMKNGTLMHALSELRSESAGLETPQFTEIIGKLESILPSIDTALFIVNIAALICPALVVAGALILYFGAKKESDYTAYRGVLLLRISCYAHIANTVALLAIAAVILCSVSPQLLLSGASFLALLFLSVPVIFFIRLACVLGGIECAFLGVEESVVHSTFVNVSCKVIYGFSFVAVFLGIINFSSEFITLVLNICIAGTFFALSGLLKNYRLRLGSSEREAENLAELIVNDKE